MRMTKAVTDLFRSSIKSGLNQGFVSGGMRAAGIGGISGMSRMAGMAAGQAAGRYAKTAKAYAFKNLGVASAFAGDVFNKAKRFDYMGAAQLGGRIGKTLWDTPGGKIGAGVLGAGIVGAGVASARGRSRKER